MEVFNKTEKAKEKQTHIKSNHLEIMAKNILCIFFYIVKHLHTQSHNDILYILCSITCFSHYIINMFSYNFT